MFGIGACYAHATDAERLLSTTRLQEHCEQMFGRGKPSGLDPEFRISPYPACWSWSVSYDIRVRLAAGELGMLFDWQELRCAVCGGSKSRLVEDHDHDTGWVRGWLCQSCNLREPGAVPGDPHPIDRRLVRYRRWNPARILGVWERYLHPFTGSDFGRLGGYQTTRPHPVAATGRVLIEDYLYHLRSPNSPADIADELFEEELLALAGGVR